MDNRLDKNINTILWFCKRTFLLGNTVVFKSRVMMYTTYSKGTEKITYIECK